MREVGISCKRYDNDLWPGGVVVMTLDLCTNASPTSGTRKT